jgi:hypothetical protein
LDSDSYSVRLPVFISIGRVGSAEQRNCVGVIFAALRRHGLEPRELPGADWTDRNPAEPILDQMSRCSGAVVIALPRIRVVTGYEWPGTPYQTGIDDRQLPTVWLQIEAALAVASRLPLLSLVDREVHAEGLLNPRHSALHAVYFDATSSQDRLNDVVMDELRDFARRVKDYANSTAG